jgi:hypothetical protein
MEEKEEYYTTNNVAGIIKIIAVITLILEIIVCIANIKYWEEYTLIGIVVSIVSTVFIYAIGELIEIMHDIRTNSEHIRDILESEKK